MAEGNEHIILKKPTITADATGQRTVSYPTKGQPGWIDVWARRQDRGGREYQFADTAGGQWHSRFEFRRFGQIEGLNVDWLMEDYTGNEYDIEAVSEAYGAKVWYWIYVVRRKPRKTP